MTRPEPKPTVESRRPLHVGRALAAAREAAPGASLAYQWPDGSRVRYRVDLAGGVLRVRWARSAAEVHDVAVQLVTTRQHLGGHRWWASCPGCGARVGVLAFDAAGTALGCRGCLGLVHASTRQGIGARTAAALARLRRVYGVGEDGARPAGMSAAAWTRYETRFQELDGTVAVLEVRRQRKAMRRVAGKLRRRGWLDDKGRLSVPGVHR